MFIYACRTMKSRTGSHGNDIVQQVVSAIPAVEMPYVVWERTVQRHYTRKHRIPC